MASKSSGRKAPSTTQATKVGVTRTGSFGSRVGGVAGRDVSGSRIGLTDAAVKSGSQAHGRSAPAMGGGNSSSGGGGGSAIGGDWTETTTLPGGQTYDPTGSPYPGPAPEPESPSPAPRSAAPSVLAPLAPKVSSPIRYPSTPIRMAPTTTTKPTTTPSVTAISIGRTSGILKTPAATVKPTALAVARGAQTAAKAEPKVVAKPKPTTLAVTRGATTAAKAEPKVVAKPSTKPLIVPRGAR